MASWVTEGLILVFFLLVYKGLPMSVLLVFLNDDGGQRRSPCSSILSSIDLFLMMSLSLSL
jgi:hypothetical protein